MGFSPGLLAAGSLLFIQPSIPRGTSSQGRAFLKPALVQYPELVMRRISGMFVALLLCVSLLTPTAGALLSTAPACCMKNVQHSAMAAGSSMPHSHCGESVDAGHIPATSAGLYAVPQGACHGCCCCLGPTISAINKVRPNASFVAPAPAESHPFLSEFYPTESSSGEFRPNAGRAPPSSEPLQ